MVSLQRLDSDLRDIEMFDIMGTSFPVFPTIKRKAVDMASCESCPSRLPEAEGVKMFGVSFGEGVSVCAQFGHVLGRPGLPEDATRKIWDAFGSSGGGCPKFGTFPSLVPSGTLVPPPRAMVARKDPNVDFNADGSMKDAVTEEMRSAVTSCASCSNFVPATVVYDELGWTLPMCAATGRLILTNRVRVEPKFCARPTLGPNRKTTDGLELLKPYQDAFAFFTIGADLKKEAVVTDPTAEATDPRSYETDEALVDADRAMGIRAWRVVCHPKDPNKSISLPIFDPASFDEVERAKIPQMGDGSGVENYVDWDGLLYKMGAVIMGMDKTPCLIGGAGLGKTEAFQYLAWMCQLPFERVSITKTSEIDDLAGKWAFEDNETKWINGRVTLGWSKRCVMVIDEFNAGPDEVEQFFRPMFDNVKQLVLDGGKGGRVERHPYSLVGLTMNPTWDIKYTGLNEISAAGLNRISSIAVGLPDEKTERAIIGKFCKATNVTLAKRDLDTLMNIARELRAASDPQVGSLSLAWGIRPQLAVVAALPYFTLMEAYKLAAIDALDPVLADIVIGIVKGHEVR